MNPTIEKVAKALRQANEELYAILKFNVHDHTWEIWIDKEPYLVNIKSHDDAESACEGLNYRYAARKAVEALRDLYKMLPGPMGNLHSHLNFNLALDKVLKCPSS